jgi:hypothetical protein
LSYSTAKSGPDRHFWVIAEAKEILRLIVSGPLFPIHYASTTVLATWYTTTSEEPSNSASEASLVAGGNLLDAPYDVCARTASLYVVKMLLHSTFSDNNKKWFTIDINDFYPGTPLTETRYKYIRIERKKIPPQSIAVHNLEPLFHNDAV